MPGAARGRLLGRTGAHRRESRANRQAPGGSTLGEIRRVDPKPYRFSAVAAQLGFTPTWFHASIVAFCSTLLVP